MEELTFKDVGLDTVDTEGNYTKSKLRNAALQVAQNEARLMARGIAPKFKNKRAQRAAYKQEILDTAGVSTLVIIFSLLWPFIKLLIDRLIENSKLQTPE
jgi:phage-related protein